MKSSKQPNPITKGQGTEQTLIDRWNAANKALFTFFEGVGANDEAHTVALTLISKSTSSEMNFLNWLKPQVSEKEHWAFQTKSSPDGLFGFALPVPNNAPSEIIANIDFLASHTWMVAWWLMYAWRARQLAIAAANHFESCEVIVAASCARGLVETAAALWSDSIKISEAWRLVKAEGIVGADGKATKRSSHLMEELLKVIWGAKFTKSKELKETFGRIERINVLGQIDKLAKRRASTLTADYEWLCNTVHPSIGNTIAFGSASFQHPTGTHTETWFAPVAILCSKPNGDAVPFERPVQSAIAQASAVALEILMEAFDDSLKVIDDFALTTRAPELALRPYWRDIRRPGRNEPCPCRSGKKAKRCLHVWGDKR